MKKITISLFVILFAFMATPLRADQPKWMQYVKPSGSFQFGATLEQNFDYSIYVRRARVAVSGTLIDDERYGKFEYLLRANLLGTPGLLDGFFKYSFRDIIGVQVGQYRTPILLENTEVSSTTVEMIDYSLVTQRFCHFGSLDLAGISASGRDIGIQLFGKLFPIAEGHHLIAYNAGVFNGAGINKRDDDQRKEYMGRVMIFPIKELCVSGSYVRAMGPHPAIAPEYNDYNWYVYDRYGGGLYYKSKYGWFRAEYMRGHTHGWLSHGAYGTLGYNINQHWDIGGRYDYFVTNVHNAFATTYHHFTGGFTWRPWTFFKLQVNYSYNMDPGVSPYHQALFQATVVF